MDVKYIAYIRSFVHTFRFHTSIFRYLSDSGWFFFDVFWYFVSPQFHIILFSNFNLYVQCRNTSPTKLTKCQCMYNIKWDSKSDNFSFYNIRTQHTTWFAIELILIYFIFEKLNLLRSNFKTKTWFVDYNLKKTDFLCL